MVKPVQRKTNDDGLRRVRQPRRKQRLWAEADMAEAVNAVQSGSMKTREAAASFRVPRSTLQSRVSGKYNAEVRPGRKPLLSKEDEVKLCDFAANRAAMGFGFGRSQFFKHAGDLSKKRGKSFKTGVPSNQWWRLFRKRNPRIVLRQPEATSTVRHKCMDPVKVAKYFVALERELAALNLTNRPQCIWNMDETGMSLEHKPQKVVASKGSKHLQSATSGNREQVYILVG